MTQTSFLTGHDPSSLAFFPQPFSSFFFFALFVFVCVCKCLCVCVCVCAYACVCIRKLTTLHREKEKSERGEKMMIVLFCVPRSSGVFFSISFCLFSFFCFFVCLIIFSLRPCCGTGGPFRSILASVCFPPPRPVSGLMTNGSKINTLTKESLQVTNYS